MTEPPLPPTQPRHDPPVDPRAKDCLARALAALELFTEAPHRLRDHSSGPGVEIFDLQEEFELGPRGQRFIVAVDPESGAVMVPVGGRLEPIA
jgi:hypothetical protein